MAEQKAEAPVEVQGKRRKGRPRYIPEDAVLVAGRVPREVADGLDRLARLRGVSRARLLVAAVEDFVRRGGQG